MEVFKKTNLNFNDVDDQDIFALRVINYIFGAINSLDITSKQDKIMITSFLEYIKCWQGYDAQKRRPILEQHVEMESKSWRAIYGYLIFTRYTRTRFAYLLAMSRESVRIAVTDSIACLRETTLSTESILFEDRDYDIVSFKVSEGLVSYYNPIHWFVAQLLASASTENGDQMQALENIPNLKSVVLELMESPLQTIVLMSQIKAEMWVRNGQSVVEQCNFYQSVLRDCFDNDILIIQLAAAFSDSDQFLITLVKRFELSMWFGLQADEPVTTIEDHSTLKLVEGIMFLIIIVISERHRIGGISREKELEREIMHHLVASKKGMTLEEIYEQCCPRLSKSVQ